MNPPVHSSAADELFALQIAQLKHDEFYHREIARLTVHARLNHMALHLCKYVGQLADRLGVTVHAIKFHLASIYRKLGVGNRTEAAGLYFQHLAPLPEKAAQPLNGRRSDAEEERRMQALAAPPVLDLPMLGGRHESGDPSQGHLKHDLAPALVADAPARRVIGRAARLLLAPAHLHLRLAEADGAIGHARRREPLARAFGARVLRLRAARAAGLALRRRARRGLALALLLRSVVAALLALRGDRRRALREARRARDQERQQPRGQVSHGGCDTEARWKLTLAPPAGSIRKAR